MILYKRNAKGEPIGWEIVDKGDTIEVSYGIVGGNCHTEVLEKKLVKADEYLSRIKAKRKEGYKEVSELKDNAPETFTDRISLINY